jgi:uncharacterized protein YkwD
MNPGLESEALSRVFEPGTYYLRVYGTGVNTSYKLTVLGLAPATNFADRVADLTNFYRTQSGIAALVKNPQLTSAAQSHSQNMALNDFYDHRGLDGSNPTQRVQAAGYRGVAGENIYVGIISPEDAMEGWFYSSGHRANILNTDYREIGTGYYYLANDGGNVNWKHYWTTVFGIPT